MAQVWFDSQSHPYYHIIGLQKSSGKSEISHWHFSERSNKLDIIYDNYPCCNGDDSDVPRLVSLRSLDVEQIVVSGEGIVGTAPVSSLQSLLLVGRACRNPRGLSRLVDWNLSRGTVSFKHRALVPSKSWPLKAIESQNQAKQRKKQSFWKALLSLYKMHFPCWQQRTSALQ